MTDAAKIKDTRRKLEAAGVEYCYASYVDVHGVPKAKVVPLASFEKMAAGSELFTVGAMDGMVWSVRKRTNARPCPISIP